MNKASETKWGCSCILMALNCQLIVPGIDLDALGMHILKTFHLPFKRMASWETSISTTGVIKWSVRRDRMSYNNKKQNKTKKKKTNNKQQTNKKQTKTKQNKNTKLCWKLRLCLQRSKLQQWKSMQSAIFL